MEPDKRFPEKFISRSSRVPAEKVVGNVPEISLLDKSREVNTVREPIEGGIVPVSRLELTSSSFSLVKAAISGKTPVR